MYKNIGWEVEFGASEDLDEKILYDLFDADPNWLEIDAYAENFSLPDDFESYEIRSNPAPMSVSFKRLRKVLSTLKRYKDKFITTDEMGVHIGVSFRSNPNVAVSLNEVEIMALFNDKKWLEVFNRDDNPTCAPHFYSVKDPVGSYDQSDTYKWIKRNRKKIKNLDELKNKLKIVHSKYASVNFSKVSDIYKEYYVVDYWGKEEDLQDGIDDFHREHGYIPTPYYEIRIAGGEGYEKKYKDIVGMVTEFSNVLDKVLVGKSKRQINNRLMKLFNLHMSTPWYPPRVPH